MNKSSKFYLIISKWIVQSSDMVNLIMFEVLKNHFEIMKLPSVQLQDVKFVNDYSDLIVLLSPCGFMYIETDDVVEYWKI